METIEIIMLVVLIILVLLSSFFSSAETAFTTVSSIQIRTLMDENHKKATCHPDFESQMSGAILTGDSVSMDGNIITGQGLGAAFPLAFELVKMFMGSEKVDEIKKDICY